MNSAGYQYFLCGTDASISGASTHVDPVPQIHLIMFCDANGFDELPTFNGTSSLRLIGIPCKSFQSPFDLLPSSAQI